MFQTNETGMSSNPTFRSDKISLVLLAHHHGSDNIASQRFRGLLRHLPKSRYNVYVFTGPWLRGEGGPDQGTVSVSAPLLSKASIAARCAVLIAMLGLGPTAPRKIGGDSWISSVVELARARVRAELAAGNRVVLMATYSPVDALIAARLVAQAEGAPFIQDFRDGLAHESLGRKGAIFRLLRKLLQNWCVRPATRITSVTRPLVSYFERTYSGVPTSLIFNGFDSTEFFDLETVKFSSDYPKSLTPSLGHFGRISGSEAARFRTFGKLLGYLEEGGFNGSLSFYGNLEKQETDLLDRSILHWTANGQVSREIAVRHMRSMTGLLVITGESEGVATGKIFEYLFSGRRIVLATLRRNEAARLLEEIGDDDIVLDFSDPGSIPNLIELAERLSRPFVRNRSKIRRFEKSEQAIELDLILRSATETLGPQ